MEQVSLQTAYVMPAGAWDLASYTSMINWAIWAALGLIVLVLALILLCNTRRKR